MIRCGKGTARNTGLFQSKCGRFKLFSYENEAYVIVLFVYVHIISGNCKTELVFTSFKPMKG